MVSHGGWESGKSDIGGNQLGLHIIPLIKVEDDICEIERDRDRDRERERARKIKREKIVVWVVIMTTLLC